MGRGGVEPGETRSAFDAEPVRKEPHDVVERRTGENGCSPGSDAPGQGNPRRGKALTQVGAGGHRHPPPEREPPRDTAGRRTEGHSHAETGIEGDSVQRVAAAAATARLPQRCEPRAVNGVPGSAPPPCGQDRDQPGPQASGLRARLGSAGLPAPERGRGGEGEGEAGGEWHPPGAGDDARGPAWGEAGGVSLSHSGSSCSFSSSLCFSAPSGDEREPSVTERILSAPAGEATDPEPPARCCRRRGTATTDGNGGRASGPEPEEEREGQGSCCWPARHHINQEPPPPPPPPQWPSDRELQLQEPDLVIEVSGGSRIRAHKRVLAAGSDFFRARLSRQFVSVRGLSHATLRALVDYLYTGGMAVSKDTLLDVVAGARFLQMPCAAAQAVEDVKAQLEVGNCLELLSLAKRHGLAELRDAAYKYMSDHYLRVLREPGVYGRLTGAERELILRRRWAEGDECLLLAEVGEVYERLSLLSSSSSSSSRESSRPQSPAPGGDGGGGGGASSSSAASSPVQSADDADDKRRLHRYDPQRDRWLPLCVIPEAAAAGSGARGCGLCTMYNYLFVAGGLLPGNEGAGARPSDRVFCYNPLTGAWSQLRAMRQGRSQLKLVALDGFLYAIGGECLFSVERYDPRSDRWSPVAPLPRGAFAVAHEAAACAGELYVSGGSLFYRLLKYDPRRDRWEECPCNSSRRRSVGMVALGSSVYRFDLGREPPGGGGGGGGGMAVFRYNAVAKVWSECASLMVSPTSSRSLQPFRCAVLGRDIYCVNKGSTLRFTVGKGEGEANKGQEDKGCLSSSSSSSSITSSSQAFHSQELSACTEGKGLLFPFVLTLPPEKNLLSQKSA
eukprot:gi/632953196/ref/XP_007892272.1/ PREDICTED: kelch repeat and BTB domain-containing protein 11 [Callorhinchus milii]